MKAILLVFLLGAFFSLHAATDSIASLTGERTDTEEEVTKEKSHEEKFSELVHSTMDLMSPELPQEEITLNGQEIN